MTAARVSESSQERIRRRTLDHTIDVYSVEGILGDEDLDRTQCRVQVCVVVRMCAECACMVGLLDEGPYGAKRADLPRRPSNS